MVRSSPAPLRQQAARSPSLFLRRDHLTRGHETKGSTDVLYFDCRDANPPRPSRRRRSRRVEGRDLHSVSGVLVSVSIRVRTASDKTVRRLLRERCAGGSAAAIVGIRLGLETNKPRSPLRVLHQISLTNHRAGMKSTYTGVMTGLLSSSAREVRAWA
jgi:hypothetical protein